MADRAPQHHVVIVGGGFAGLHAARQLGRAGYAVTLLDKRNFHLFQPLLYQVATGSLAPGNIAIPQRVVLRKYKQVRCLKATAFDLDPAKKLLRHEHGELQYDSLIVATGVKHHYFGNDQWREFAPGLKTVEHAIEIRRKLFRAFELAEQEADPDARRALMNFVIVGGGPTGVELAGAIGELCHKTMVEDFRKIDPRDARILLIEGADGVLPVYPKALQDKARKQLQTLGVEVITQTMVTDINVEGVKAKGPQQELSIAARTVLWAAGVRASMFGEVLAERTGVPLDRGGRVKVQEDCSLASHPEIFVIGDLARLTDAKGVEVPGLAPAAIQQGRYVAGVIKQRQQGRKTTAFRYRNKGSMAVIGFNRAVGDLNGFKVAGIAAWFMWAFVHIWSLIDGQQRVAVFTEWAWKYITRRSGDRLITGDPPKTSELRARQREQDAA